MFGLGLGGIGLGGALNAGGGAPVVPVPDAVYLPTVGSAPTVAWGVRRLISAYSGALMEVQRASDSANMDVPQLANGLADAAAVASWAAGSEVSVRTVYDQTGNARHLQQTTYANMPLFDVTGALGVYGAYNAIKAVMFDGYNTSGVARVPKWFVIPTSVAYNRASMTQFLVVEPHSALQNNAYTTFFGSSLSTAQSIVGPYMSGGSNAPSTRRIRQQYQTIAAIGGAGAFKFYQDGVFTPDQTAKTSAATTGGQFGESGTPGTGDFLANNDNYLGYVLYPAALSNADVQAVAAALDSTFGIVAPSVGQVVGVGDSILFAGPANAGPSHKCQITWRKVRALLASNPAFYNMGVGSYTLAAAITNASAREYALAAQDSFTKRVLFIQVGTNDMSANGGTPGYGATLYSSLTSYITNARAAGYTKIVVCTLLPRSNSADWNPGSQRNIEMADYNTRVRANAAGADVICDRAAHPIMGVYANTSDTTYYQDALHPTALGYELLAAGDAAAINAALAA